MAFHDADEMELFTLEFTKNLYSTYTRLREEDPVHQVRFPDGKLVINSASLGATQFPNNLYS
ncbi:hypothetical protein I858_004515 [Planococcus versutus]|uniref:Uncharacterized protein n=1 Tax=Planococcus versutus TaxID=1302659 RepID=A0A1B1RZE3_9BACL|nr:hypothetical protein I858_004515 [Planococcus versutus]